MMIILIRVLVMISAFLIFLTPILTICTSLNITILMESVAVLLVVNYLAYKKERKNKRREIMIFNVVLIVLLFIVYRYANIIGLGYIFGAYGSILVGMTFHLFSPKNKVVMPHDIGTNIKIKIKTFNVIWAGLMINFIGYPYMESNFIKVEAHGAIPSISFMNCNTNFILIGILYVCIVFIQVLMDRKSLNIKKYMNHILFYQYCTGILMVLIPTIHLIYLGVL